MLNQILDQNNICARNDPMSMLSQDKITGFMQQLHLVGMKTNKYCTCNSLWYTGLLVHACYDILHCWIQRLKIKFLKEKTQKNKGEYTKGKYMTFTSSAYKYWTVGLNNKASSIFKSYCLLGSWSVLFSLQLNSKWSVHMTDYSAELALWLLI